LQPVGISSNSEFGQRLPQLVFSVLSFIWLNAVLLRTLHQWAEVPLSFDGIVASTLAETSLSIFWAILAIAAMLLATRRRDRPLWFTGLSLLPRD
jgi:uncharacterized membrane protein